MFHLRSKSGYNNGKINRRQSEENVLSAVVNIRTDFDYRGKKAFSSARVGKDIRQIERIKLRNGKNECGHGKRRRSRTNRLHKSVVVTQFFRSGKYQEQACKRGQNRYVYRLSRQFDGLRNGRDQRQNGKTEKCIFFHFDSLLTSNSFSAPSSETEKRTPYFLFSISRFTLFCPVIWEVFPVVT